MFSLLYEIFYKPIFNALYAVLFFLYDTVAFMDFGIAIILLTLVVRVVLYPLFHKGMYHQSVMTRLQPQIKELQKKHKGDMQKQSEALLELYREHKVNPFSGFLFLLLQLPVFIAIYGLIRSFESDTLTALYSFVSVREVADFTFLGLINMHERSIILIVIAVILQYLQGRQMLQKAHKEHPAAEDSPAEAISRNMMYLMPGITAVILWSFPSALALYWGATTLFSMGQQYLINKALVQKAEPQP
jgi:YidC/Oxa1 family membrane protein insertase